MDRRPFCTSMTRISPLPEERETLRIEELPRDGWETGDYVAVEVVSSSAGQRIELTSGRMVEVAEGDLVLGALGRRHATLEATGSWEEVGPDGRISFLTGAGLLGAVTSLSSVLPPLTSAVYRGHVHRDGAPARMRDFVASVPDRDYRIPTVLLIGTSMSAGKTTAARKIIRQLKSADLGVVAAKLTGAGRYRDVLTMGDAGADAIFDFMDVGLPSTVCPAETYRPALDGLLSRMAGTDADVAVVEVGASPLEPYNGETAIDGIRHAVRCTVLCASDPYAVVGVMEAYGARPDLVTGVASNTRAGVELTETLTGVPTLDVRDKSARPELRGLLEDTLEL